MDTANAYHGSKSLKLTRSTAGTAGGVYSSSFTVAKGETYTFSAWVKTGSGMIAYLALTDGNTLYFAYDASGTPLSVTYNGTNYYYATNMQGDVTAILNTSGTAVVQYTYDAWGKLLTTTGSMASTLGTYNPLRYRGYVYDTETGLYYLQSRYYNPGTGRFINADILVSTGQGLLSNNMFAYCLNNPVNGCDPCGTCFHRLDFWNACEKCGGKTIGEKWDDVTEWCVDAYDTINNFHQQQQLLEMQITMQQNKMLGDATKAMWDAYNYAYNMQQEAQRKERQMIIDLFSTAETASMTLNVVGAELVFIGCFWSGQILTPVGAGLLLVAAVVAFGE